MARFRNQYISDEEKSLEDGLLQDPVYSSVFWFLNMGDEKRASQSLEVLKQKYSSPDFKLDELSWLGELIKIQEDAKKERMPAKVSLDLRCGEEQANKRFVVNHNYYNLVERNYDNPLVLLELGKVIQKAPQLTVATKKAGQEDNVSNARKAQESLFFFDQALFVDPEYVDAYIAKAEALFSMARPIEAVEALSKAKANLTELDKAAREYVSEKNPQMETAKLISSTGSIKNISDIDALDSARKILVAGIVDGSINSVVYLNAASRILEELEKRELSPEDRAALSFYRGIALWKDDSIDEAVSYLNDAVAINPETYKSRLNRPLVSEGLVAIARGQNRGLVHTDSSGKDLLSYDAIEESWLRVDSMSPEEKINYSHELLASGLKDSKLKQDRVLKAQWVLSLLNWAEGLSEHLQSEKAYCQAVSYQMTGEDEPAKDALRESVRLNPDNVFAQKRLTDIELEEIVQKARTEEFDVTYIMPAYNAARVEARKAIDSILKSQVFDGSIQLIYIDDGSTEGATADFVRSQYSEFISDGSLKVIKSVNQGAAAARNYGLKIFEAGSSKFCAVLDSDDIALPDRTQKSVDYLNAHDDVGFVHGKADFILATGIPKDDDIDPSQVIDQDGSSQPAAGFWRDMWKQGHERGLAIFRSYESPIVCPSVMVKGETIGKAGYLNTAWYFGEDMVFWGSLCRTGAKLGFIDDEIIQYRLRPE